MLRDYSMPPADFTRYMQRRAELGRMVRTTEVMSTSGSGSYDFVWVKYNTEFERGHALEDFHFRIDGAALRLNTYHYQIGKKLACPTVKLFSQCWLEDAPIPGLGSSS
jgi:hypothetical protein